MQAEQIEACRWTVTDDDGQVYTVIVPSADDTAERAIASLTEAQAGPTADDLLRDRIEAVKASCKRRIYAVASAEAQMNIIGAQAAGDFDTAQQAAYAASVQWIADMRAACAAIIADSDLDPADDANWPDCPAAVAALAAAF